MPNRAQHIEEHTFITRVRYVTLDSPLDIRRSGLRARFDQLVFSYTGEEQGNGIEWQTSKWGRETPESQYGYLVRKDGTVGDDPYWLQRSQCAPVTAGRIEAIMHRYHPCRDATREEVDAIESLFEGGAYDFDSEDDLNDFEALERFCDENDPEGLIAADDAQGTIDDGDRLIVLDSHGRGDFHSHRIDMHYENKA